MNPVYIFSLIVFCETVQVWLALIAISALVPQANALSTVVWPEWQYFVHPERDCLLYHSFVGIALSAQAIGIWCFRHKLKEASFVRAMKSFLAVEILWTALMLNASFKVIVFHDRAGLAHEAFIVLALGACLSKIFWQELQVLSKRYYQKIMSVPLDWRADVLACLGLIALLYVPDSEAVLARIFFGDHFHHFDSYLAPAWAHYKGGVLNVDVMTEYGVGIPVMMSWFAKCLGGFTYIHLFWFLMWGTIVYFVLCFIFLRRWLGSFVLALIATLLAIKFQMFHFSVAPIVFTYPSSSVIRYWWDVLFFLLLWQHLNTWHKRYLLAASICCGVQIFCMNASGYCLTIAFFSYLTALIGLKHYRSLVCKNAVDFVWWGGFVVLVPLTTLMLLGLTQGEHLWTHEFWSNMQEFNHYFLAGFGLMPIYENLQNKEILMGFMGFIIPLVYMGSFLVTAGLVYWGKVQREYLMAAIIALYGLVMYHYFLGRSGGDDYYKIAVPYAFILGFWAKQAIGVLQQETRRRVLLGLSGLVIYSLLSNHSYLSYPNCLNISRNPIVDPLLVQPMSDGLPYFNSDARKIKEEDKLPVNSLGETDEGIKYEKDFKTDAELKSYYESESDFSRDAALIDSLTRPSQPVALLSSYEMKMLIQANRRQFFYYSPILIARPMRMRSFPISALYSSGHLQRTLAQLQGANPEYIFMEKIFLQAPGTKNFRDPCLAQLLNYIFANYAPDLQGQYLVAFKRKQT